MTQSDITEFKPYMKEDDIFVIITGSQYSIINTPSTPVIFDDAKQRIYYFSISNHRTNNTHNGNKRFREMQIFEYEQIESIILIQDVDDIIKVAQAKGITGSDLDRVKKALSDNHGTYINENENVKG
jgi:hypothetical protein